jgi:hypothetical protein
MSEDLMSAVGLVSGSLLDKLASNRDLCNSVVALVGFMSTELSGAGAKRVNISDVEMVERQMRARITISRTGYASVAASQPCSDKLLEFMGQEGILFYRFVNAHPDVVKWIRQIIEKMETYAMQKGVAFSSIEFGDHGAFVDKAKYIVLEIAA